MNQEKTGKFIASCRKEKALTQAVLAEKLGITDRAVSKWETGKSMPDAGIMLELCEILGISVTELLVGERITMENYRKETESEMVEMAAREKEKGRRMLIVLLALIFVSIAAGTVMICASSAICEQVWKVTLAITATVVLATGIFTVLIAEYKTGYYKCKNCGKVYIPHVARYLFAFNFGLQKKMKCPYCKKHSWHNKVFTK